MTAVKLLVGFVSFIADYKRLAAIRVRCIRNGHAFLCITDGHLCRTCGRTWIT